jgi:hypothetical protein
LERRLENPDAAWKIVMNQLDEERSLRHWETKDGILARATAETKGADKNSFTRLGGWAEACG